MLIQIRTDPALLQDATRLSSRQPSWLLLPPRAQGDEKGFTEDPRMSPNLEPLRQCLARRPCPSP